MFFLSISSAPRIHFSVLGMQTQGPWKFVLVDLASNATRGITLIGNQRPIITLIAHTIWENRWSCPRQLNGVEIMAVFLALPSSCFSQNYVKRTKAERKPRERPLLLRDVRFNRVSFALSNQPFVWSLHWLRWAAMWFMHKLRCSVKHQANSNKERRYI